MKYDGSFLKKLDNAKLKTLNIRISSYGIDDSPNEIIEGQVVSGSINVDGTSNIRRSCSLSLIAKNISINEYYWCFNTRFKVEVGITNEIDAKYPSIIWFNMGYFLITGFNTSVSSNGYNVNINGKDKMCLLNGELGGTFEAPINFDTDEYEDLDGTISRNKIHIKTIIKNLIHFYGNEPYYKILINDIPEFGLELERYLGVTPFYILGTSGYKSMQATIDEGYSISYPIEDENGQVVGYEDPINLNQVPEENLYYANELLSAGVRSKQTPGGYRIHKVEYGESCGYKLTDLVYPDDLIVNAGETITSVLDKIKTMLGPYEYFYDLDGNFVFQKQQKFIPKINYVEDSYNANNDSMIFDPENVNGNGQATISYSFDNNNLVISISNNPNHSSIKNDFSVWGKRETLNGKEEAIHFRYAIDHKPMHTYVSIGLNKNIVLPSNETVSRARYVLQNYPKLFKIMNNETLDMAERRLKQTYQEKKYNLGTYDWRELIYRMAKDFFAFNQIDEFRAWLEEPPENAAWIINGKTGYEIYYTDIEAFWPSIYKTDLEISDLNSTLEDKKEYKIYNDQNVLIQKIIYDLGDPYYDSPIEGDRSILSDFYYGENDNIKKVDVFSIVKKNYLLLNNLYISWADQIQNNIEPIGKKIIQYYYKGSDNDDDYRKLDKDVLSNEELMKQEIFVKVNGKYLTQGTLQWPLKIKNGNSDYEIIEAIYTESGQSISFNNQDNNLKLLSKMFDIGTSVTTDTVGNWDTNFFPFIEEWATEDNPYIEDFRGFNKSALKNPENLTFWFDLLDKEDSEISKYSIQNIGDRKKNVSDDAIKSIYYLYTPDILFDVGDYTEEQQAEYNKQNESSGYIPINIPSVIKDDFSISTQGKSAYSVLENLLYNYTYCADQINLTALPVYYLQPNTLININDDKTSIDGNYIVEKISYNLAVNSTMTVTCVKNVEDDRDRKEYWT